VHLPRTGGTVVANLLVSNICNPFEENIALLGWKDACSKTCEMGFTDNEFTCFPRRIDFEHNAYALNMQRAEALKLEIGAQNIVYVTTLRRGSDRLVSQWLHEVKLSSWIPPPGVEPISNESLQLFITGGAHTGLGWMARKSPSLRNNLQVGQLASVYTDLESTATVTRAELEVAKQVLMQGEWVIGFTDCLDQLQSKLLLYAESVHGSGLKQKAVPVKEACQKMNGAERTIALDQETSEMLDSHCSLDNELHDWAWDLAAKGTDSRFAGTC